MKINLVSLQAARTSRLDSRRGSVLVEFAMVSFVLYLLLVVLLDLGRATLGSHTIQDAATVLANELARAPLPASMSFEEALRDDWVIQVIYDSEKLVIPITGNETQVELEEMYSRLPIVNQMLRPLMIHDELPGGEPVIRYPGALVSTPEGGYSVFIPQVVGRSWDGEFTGGYETIRFLPVMEELHDSVAEPDGHFAIDSQSPLAGFVNLRCNYPYQAGAMTAYYRNPDEPDVFGPKHAVQANDQNVSVQPGGELPPGYSLIGSGFGDEAAPYDGKYGLGFHYLGRKRVRPFRKLLSAQAAARREIVVPQ
jgi:hypothetical protein